MDIFEWVRVFLALAVGAYAGALFGRRRERSDWLEVFLRVQRYGYGTAALRWRMVKKYSVAVSKVPSERLTWLKFMEKRP